MSLEKEVTMTQEIWMHTYTGRRYTPLAPKIEDIDIVDIAHALSHTCRFGGHSRDFYSVAQHCFVASLIVPKEYALWALLHDAAEAYVGDIIRPIKYGSCELHAAFSDIEDKNLKVIAEKYGLCWPMPECIKIADDIVLYTELRDILGSVPYGYCSKQEPLQNEIVPLEPHKAESVFLERFWTLFEKR